MKNKLILILTLLSIVVLGFPLVIFGAERIFFYGIDPEIVYVTNALLYTKYAIISYADHPGTPTIMFLYFLFIPLRLIAKFLLHIGFIQWSFDNFVFLMYYARIFELLLYCGSIYLFLKSIFNLNKSFLLVVFAWVSILVLNGFGWGIRIVPENLSFFLTGLWLLIFVYFIKHRLYIFNILLVFIAGLAMANKFTGLSLGAAAILLPILLPKFSIFKRSKLVAFNLLIFVASFFVGILPAIERLSYLDWWVKSLFYHSGIHGAGKQAIFDWQSYSSSFIKLIYGMPLQSIFILVAIIACIYLLVKKKISVLDPVVLLFGITLGVMGIFAKYPNVHYMFVNLILVVFCASYFFSKLKFMYIKLITILLIIISIFAFRMFATGIDSAISSNKTDSVNGVLNSWTPFWALDIFREQLDAKGY